MYVVKIQLNTLLIKTYVAVYNECCNGTQIMFQQAILAIDTPTLQFVYVTLVGLFKSITHPNYAPESGQSLP